jgi:hypothetical protein
LVVFAAGCGGSALSRLVGIAAHQVNITPGVPQHSAAGDTVYFDIANSGFSSAYLQECGDGPQVTLQVLKGAGWQSYGPAVACPTPTVPGPIELKSGEEKVVNRLFTEPGTYRAGVSVGTSVTMSDAQMAYTISFTIQ